MVNPLPHGQRLLRWLQAGWVGGCVGGPRERARVRAQCCPAVLKLLTETVLVLLSNVLLGPKDHKFGERNQSGGLAMAHADASLRLAAARNRVLDATSQDSATHPVVHGSTALHDSNFNTTLRLYRALPSMPCTWSIRTAHRARAMPAQATPTLMSIPLLTRTPAASGASSLVASGTAVMPRGALSSTTASLGHARVRSAAGAPPWSTANAPPATSSAHSQTRRRHHHHHCRHRRPHPARLRSAATSRAQTMCRTSRGNSWCAHWCVLALGRLECARSLDTTSKYYLSRKRRWKRRRAAERRVTKWNKNPASTVRRAHRTAE